MVRGKDDKNEKDGEASAEGRSGTPSGPEKDAAKSAGSGRRPPHTIDLKAKEVDEAAAGDADKPDADAKQDSSKPKDSKAGKDDASKPADDAAASKAGPKPKPAPPRTTSGQLRGFATHLAAGLVGGLVGVVGLGYGVGIPGTGQPPAETAPAEATPETKAKLTDLDDRLAGIEERWKAQAEFPAAMKERAMGLEAAAADREARLARVEEVLAAQNGFPASMKERAVELERRAGALDERLGRIEERWKAQQGFPAAMKERVARLEDTIKSLGEAASSGGDVAATAAFASKLNEVAAQIDAKVNDLRRDVDALSGRLDTLPEPESKDAASDALTARIDDLEKKVAALAARKPVASATGSETPSGRLDALAHAIARGLPFADELAKSSERLREAMQAADLQRYAATGAPTRSVLLQRLQDYARGAPAKAPAEASVEPSLISQFLGSAQSLVRVRRMGDPAGADASPAVARMLSLVRQGDLAGAILAAEQLSAEERGSLEEWLQAAQSRVDVDAGLAEVRRRLDGTDDVTGSTQGQ